MEQMKTLAEGQSLPAHALDGEPVYAPTVAPPPVAMMSPPPVVAKQEIVGQNYIVAGHALPGDEINSPSQLIQDGETLFEMGKLDDSEAKLKEVLKTDPKNSAASYCLGLVQETRNKGTITVTRTLPVFSTTAGTQAAPGSDRVTYTNFTFTYSNAATAGRPIEVDNPLPKTPSPAPIPQPEILAAENAFSTFSLNVSDVSFKLAAASLEKGQLPDAASIRSEEFINAFDYHDPEPAAGVPVAFVAERANDPFAQNRDLLRFSVKTAAAGREAGRPLNIVLLLDNSGSMERADRVAIIHEALKVLASQLQPQDTLSIVTFARTARLWVDGARGDQAGTAVNEVSDLTPEGGTNLEEAMNLAYATARRHYLAQGVNRVVLLTDGAANLGNVDPEALKQKVESFRKQGIALDCFGIGWEGYNDDLLEVLSSNGDGRYGFINTPEAATTEFAAQLAGALHVAAEDVKVQVEFNPQRVISWRQIGYAKHQLTKEQFRDNTVAAAPLAAREAGNALYTVEINPQGAGPVATVRVRFRIPGTTDVSEHEWAVPFDGTAPALEKSSPALRLAATASAFSEWLASSPFAQEVTTDQLLNYLNGVPAIYGADARPKQLETMIREAKSLSGK
jgi:Mg-chelatase subunit ChlD